MRHGQFGAVLLLLTGAGLAAAQQPAPPAAAAGTSAVPPAQPGPSDGEAAPGPFADPDGYRPTQAASAYPYFTWASAEYLLWRFKNGPKPPPLVTTGPADAANPAVLGAQGTVVLFPRDQTEYGGFAGGRWEAGFWCDACETLGVEVSGFLTEQRADSFRAASDASGAPVLGVPFVDAQTGQESVSFATFPGRFSGGVLAASTARLWGMEGDLLANEHKAVVPWGDGPFPLGDLRVDLLGGFRYASLTESLSVSQSSAVLAGGAADFAGMPVQTPDVLGIGDGFQARSQFYGGQLGARAEFARGPFYLDVLGKLALGDSHQSVRVTGNTTLLPVGADGLPSGPPLTVPGGLLATATNLGRTERDRFAVVPEFRLAVGYQPVPQFRLFAGYTLLYWSDVVRAGDQIDRVVNLTQVPSGGTFGPLSGPARPSVPFKSTDFWAQGVQFGFEVRY
jgi:hypothetical protein